MIGGYIVGSTLSRNTKSPQMHAGPAETAAGAVACGGSIRVRLSAHVLVGRCDARSAASEPVPLRRDMR
jgi:hypothetical protein